MQRTYSTLIIPENSEELLFSIKCDSHLYHCWKNTKEDKFVVVKESNDFSIFSPTQLMNFSERELKQYLFIASNKLKKIDAFLFFNDLLWKIYFEK